MAKGVIGCVKERVPGDTEPLGTDKKPENTVPNGFVLSGSSLYLGADTLRHCLYMAFCLSLMALCHRCVTGDRFLDTLLCVTGDRYLDTHVSGLYVRSVF